MKAPLFLLFSIAFFNCNSLLQAQSQSDVPKWMSEKGYWVIQSNLKTPKDATIFFYTPQHELIYKELISGKKINIEKIKTRKHLEKVLNQAITVWGKEGVVKENQQLVIMKR